MEAVVVPAGIPWEAVALGEGNPWEVVGTAAAHTGAEAECPGVAVGFPWVAVRTVAEEAWAEERKRRVGPARHSWIDWGRPTLS